MWILVKRRIHHVPARWREHTRLTGVIDRGQVRALVIRPSVVSAFANNFDFFPFILSDVAHPDIARLRINAESPRMSKTDREKLSSQLICIHSHTVQIGDTEK